MTPKAESSKDSIRDSVKEKDSPLECPLDVGVASTASTGSNNSNNSGNSGNSGGREWSGSGSSSSPSPGHPALPALPAMPPPGDRTKERASSLHSPGQPGPGPNPNAGTRGNLASQPGTDAESLQDMSVRGLDLLKYAHIASDGSYRCIQCEKVQIVKSFKNKYSFQRHAFLYHEGANRKVFPCPVCQKEFSRPDKMKQHLKQVHDCIIPKHEAGAGPGAGPGPVPPHPAHFLINPFLAPLDDPAVSAVAAMDGLKEAAGRDTVFKLMSQLSAHQHHATVAGSLKSPGGQGAS